MHELPKACFSQAGRLLAPFSHYLVVPAVLQGRSRGRIWIDDEVDPATCLCWDMLDDFLFLVGDPSDAERRAQVRQLLVDTILPEARRRGSPRLHMQFAPITWEQRLPAVLQGIEREKKDVRLYTWPPGAAGEGVGEAGSLPAGFEVVSTTGDFPEGQTLDNAGEVFDTIKACWGSVDRYQAEGIGFALVGEGAIAAWCSTDFVLEGAAEIYVLTFKPYRKRGWGTLVARACVRECLRRCLSIHWHCWEDNIGSIRIAERVGLTQTGECPGYFLQVPGE
jgi:GNAT superfamily N-acetyltransferase